MSGEAAAPSLGDFFKSKSKKKVKASNLNKDATPTKTEDPKKKTKTDDDNWQEETVEASTMKVEVAGKLIKEEEKKDDEDTAAPAWGNVKKQAKESSANPQLTDKRYPTLGKANASSNINIDDGSDAKVNIQTTKNHFAAIQNEDSDDEDTTKRPTEIKPAMVSKKQGEFTKVAVQREVEKYSAKKESKKKKAKKEEGEDEEDDDEEEEGAEAEEAEEPAPVVDEEGTKKKKDEKKAAKKAAPEQDCADEDVAEDLKIQVDLEASKEKYKGRKRMPPVNLPKEELEAEKENRRVQPTSGGKKKKMCVEEETDKKLSYAEW